MRVHDEELAKRNVGVRIVTFDADFMALAYVKQTNCPWPLLIDADKKLYAGYSMTRGSWWSIVGPRSIWKYIRLMLKGQKLQKPGSDHQQLGGDVLVDPDGVIRLHFISNDPHDRPTIESILDLVGSNVSGTKQNGPD